MNRAYLQMLNRAGRLSGIILVTSLFIGGCTRPTDKGTAPTFVDDRGHPVQISAPPVRVISLLPSITEIICALDACPLLVATDDHSNYPESLSSLPKVGGLTQINREMILSLKPDLVFTSIYGPGPESLDALGLPTMSLQVENLADIRRVVSIVGTVLDRNRQAEDLAERIDSRLEHHRKSSASRTQPRVYVEIDTTPYSAGPTSFIGELIAIAGGQNIVPPELGAFPQLAPEFVIEQDPEIIILLHPPPSRSVEMLAERPGWDSITAVQERRVCSATPQQSGAISRPGPRIIEALESIEQCLASKATVLSK